ncbi:MAG: hypothetical protein IKW74_01840 [Thermoguttaceae bacterium]|nr:hypothetical protein [Thermoguttaceae bacterium]
MSVLFCQCPTLIAVLPPHFASFFRKKKYGTWWNGVFRCVFDGQGNFRC